MHTLRLRTVEGGRFLGPLALFAVKCVNFWPDASISLKSVGSISDKR